MQEETARTQRKLGQARSLLRTALGGETAWNTLLHSHSHPRSPPTQAISFHFISFCFEVTRQKSRDCLVSGDRETQGTESIVRSLGRDFQPVYVVVFWSLVVKGEPPHKGDKNHYFQITNAT